MNALFFSLSLVCAATDPVETSQNPETLLYVRTTPTGAEIELDGKSLGTSDGLFPVKLGDYKIVVNLEAHQPAEQRITVRDGRITRIELTLKKRPAVAAKEVLLPDVDRQDCNTVLDLASGKLIENFARNDHAYDYIKLGKGDFWHDNGFFGTLRGGTAMIWDGERFMPFDQVRDHGGTNAYGHLKLPCRLLVTTAEKKHFDITIEGMDAKGSARLEYRPAEEYRRHPR